MAAPARTLRLAGWGRLPRADCRVIEPADGDEVAGIVAREGSLIARGSGRAYGDAALNPQATLLTERLDRVVAFDPASGLLVAEAGLRLDRLIARMLPQGWFVPVTPGTKFVTLGGMAAADVHGKNHHVAGSFGRHVAWLDLVTADGRTVRCSPTQNAALFAATIGGMGLTGVIVRVALRLMPVETAFIRQETVRTADLEETIALFESRAGATYSVAWIDTMARGARLGRSVVMLGEHARRDELPVGAAPFAPSAGLRLGVPFDLPGVVLNRATIRLANALYYRLARPGTRLVPLDPFFYPLDAVANWNRIYGRRGFLQYQFVLPAAAGAQGMRTILARIARDGQGSFLAVLKLFGAQDGMLSFPMPGPTLALDFPANAGTFRLLPELDAMVADFGGRLYLAKDARMGAELLARGYPDLAAFKAVRAGIDPARRFRSLQAERLGL